LLIMRFIRTRGFLSRFAAPLAVAAYFATSGAALAAATPVIAIAQYPLTVVIPAHPQVLLAVGNSQSMDGDLSGAILTGSGGLGAAYAGLNASSSPLNYTVPLGFTAPVSGTAAGNAAPYTVTVGGTQYDNSASRLNVAKAGVTSILNSFLPDADFGLISYQTSGNNAEATWVYYMSPPGGFTFTNTPLALSRYVPNPCFGIALNNSTPVNNACQILSGRYPGINTYADMAISTSSDDPLISDVLYWCPGCGYPIFVQYNGPSPLNPFTDYTLAQYNSYQVEECYNSTDPNIGGGICETPTNAGFVPYSTEVMNVARGFGFYTTGETAQPSSTTSWPPLVPMTSAGQTPTTASINTALGKFTSFLAPETNLTGTSELKAQATQSPIAGLLKASQDYYSAKNPASSNGCTALRYVVLVTDGLPTMDLSGKAWPPLGSAAATGYGETASFNADGSYATSNDQALIDTINALAALKTAGIKTYIIALGAGVDPTTIAGQTMTAMAIAGGTSAYFSAQNVATLDADMQVILAKILAETAATSAASVNSTGINTKSVAYQGKFTTSDLNQDWTGDLLAFPINATNGFINTALSAALWSAQAQLDFTGWDVGRQIATWDPVAGTGIPFRWNPSTTTTTGIASSTTLGQDFETFAADTNGQDVLQFLRGSSAQELQNGGHFRNRTHKLGDIVDSSPLYIAGPTGPWQQGAYISFQATYVNREPMVYVGANDGMLHAFDAATGVEKFAYIPRGVYSNLELLVNPYYNSVHHFYVDGSPNAADVQFASDQTWHTVLLGSEAAGGNSIFAIDVTNPAAITSELALGQSVLWDFTDGNMGDTYSTPVAVDTAAGFAIMFGNGYDSPTGTPFLYALNPQTGAIMAKIDLCGAVPTACNLGAANGLSSVAAMNTSGLLSQPSNVLYAGDLQGNLWRVDISNANPTAWTVSVLFQARDSLGNPQPITVEPALTLNPLVPTLKGSMVYFGTGQFLSVADLGNTQTQTVYGVFDSGTPQVSPLTRANLTQQTMTGVPVTTAAGYSTVIRQLSGNPVLLPSTKGWYVDLSLDAGERVVTNPSLFDGTLQLTTYQPNPNPCLAGGQAYYMVFNYATGGSTTVPQFDWNGNGAVTNADLYMGGTVAGVSLGTSYASAPKLITGAGGAVAYTTLGGGEKTTGASAGTCTQIPGTTSCIPGWNNQDFLSHGAWQEIR
jgi:type IV pilus assembly protein PilY1